MTITKNNKKYRVESVAYGGAVTNVNGTSITDRDLFAELVGDKYHVADGSFSVFCDGDEISFPSFQEAYEFATTKQENTYRL